MGWTANTVYNLIMTYTQLQDLIKNFCDSTETTFVNTIADFIKNSEERIFQLVEFDFFRKNVTGVFTAGNRFFNNTFRLYS